MPRVVLTDEQLIGKANRLIDKLHRQCILNNAEANLLRICITKWGYAKREKETTEIWAMESFAKNDRLISLIKERWEAGWKGRENG